MNTQTTRRLAGLLLIIVPLAFTALFTLLQIQFEYPDILRQPTADILTKFQAGGSGLIAAWYGLTLSAILFIPVVLLLHNVLAGERAPITLWVATTFGVVAGVAQALGFLRWPFLVPYLAQAYLDPAASESQRAAAAMVFEAFHRYAGMAVGEHLGYLSTSTWTFLVAIVMLRVPLFGRWIGLSGMALALGVATGLLEPAGVPFVGAINAISYLAWALWLIIVGAVLLVRRPDALSAQQTMAVAR
jgi:hypothetical protein